MNKDYYQILGIDKSASQDEIKRAYRKLAHQYHPDKNEGHTDGVKFKEINEAYQVLSNPQKKAHYDQFGQAPDSDGYSYGGGEGFGGFDFRDFGGFSSRSSGGFGGIGDIFEDLFSGVFSQIQAEVEISLISAILGDTLNFKTSQGELITLKIPAGTQDGSSFRLPGKGAASRRGRGDLIITVRTKIPKHLSRQQKELLEKLKESGL